VSAVMPPVNSAERNLRTKVGLKVAVMVARTADESCTARRLHLRTSQRKATALRWLWTGLRHDWRDRPIF
jgi:hypothetical protein